MKEVLGYSFDELIAIPDDDFVSTLKAKKIKNEGLDKIAELLLLAADNEGTTERGKQFYKKSFFSFRKVRVC